LVFVIIAEQLGAFGTTGSQTMAKRQKSAISAFRQSSQP